ncbi:MAG TPA: hypothetical protein VJ753_03600 [Rhizomicrobium sp.]|nr:hypothetical protein [Rhizomicrobium sp.]
MAGLTVIPLEIGDPLELVRRHPERARAMAFAATDTFGAASRLAAAAVAPAADRASRAWLLRQNNRYLPEIDAMAAILGIRGVHALNVCFEWGCTGGIWPSPDGPVLRRVLDWPFPKLGESLVVAHQLQEQFFNIGWPGLAGLFQGLAPGRFAAAIHQAPMRRHGRGYVGDWFTNRVAAGRGKGLPPAHLLRSIFETAPDYAAAKKLLCETVVAVPAIFLLAGTQGGEGCVIERLEESWAVREMGDGAVCAANHFEALTGAWRPRPIDSAGRAACARGLEPMGTIDDFSWFKAPIANVNSRLVFTASAQRGALSLMGTRGPQPTTQIFRLN